MTTTTESLISYPPPEPESTPQASTYKAVAPQIRQDRLYIGNLHSTVDEYTLVKAFERFGKITSLDFLFHKSGPSKGKPRGYAFIEYSSKDEALKAIVAMHDKLVRGRNLVVTFAHQAPPLDDNSRTLRKRTDTSRPTALSLMKSHGRLGTQDKIVALEAKLAQLQQSNLPATSSGGAAISASLPARPPPNLTLPGQSKTTQRPPNASHASTHTQPLHGAQHLPIVHVRNDASSSMRRTLLDDKKPSTTAGGLPLLKNTKTTLAKPSHSLKQSDLGIKKLDTSLGIKKRGHRPCEEPPLTAPGK